MSSMPYECLGDKVTVRTPWVLLFSTPFAIWQMGIIYFSGTTLSLGGVPLHLAEQDTTLVILAGYLASIVAVCIAPRRTVVMGRALLPVGLVAALALFAPLPLDVATALFFVEAFVCVFMIGAMASTAAHLFTLETVWRDGLYSVLIGGTVIALLHSGFVPVPFAVFNGLSVVLVALLGWFYLIIPARIGVSFERRGEGGGGVRLLVAALWFVVALSALLVCFANSFAERVAQGMPTLELSAAACAGLLLVARRHVRRTPTRAVGLLVLVSAVGFALASFSLQFPALQLVACALMGPMVLVSGIWLVFVTLSFELRASRFVGAVGAAVGLAMAMAHAGLLGMLRDEPAMLFGLYAVLAVLLAGVYAAMEPYVVHAWHRTMGERAPAWARHAGTLVDARDERADAADGARVEGEGTDLAVDAAASSFAGSAAPNASGHAAPSAPDPSAALPTGLESDARLSGQERVLARLILQGYTESDICREMNITLNTQKSYRKNLYTKLGIHSKRELFEHANRVTVA